MTRDEKGESMSEFISRIEESKPDNHWCVYINGMLAVTRPTFEACETWLDWFESSDEAAQDRFRLEG